jgi:hypothetical protein
VAVDGSYDSYQEWAATQPVMAPVVYWSYILLVALLMMNILMAIAIDAYIAVSEDTKGEETLLRSLLDVLHLARARAFAVLVTCVPSAVGRSAAAAATARNKSYSVRAAWCAQVQAAGLPAGITQHLTREALKAVNRKRAAVAEEEGGGSLHQVQQDMRRQQGQLEAMQGDLQNVLRLLTPTAPPCGRV